MIAFNESQDQNINTFETNHSDINLRLIRNEVVGSPVNKLVYIQNGTIKKLMKQFIEVKDYQDYESLKHLFSILNSYVISNPVELGSQLDYHSNLTQSTVKLLLANTGNSDVNFFETGFRLLKNMALEEKVHFFSIENCFSSGLMSKIEEFLYNDILFQYISIIIGKFCESSYYKQTIFRNDKLIQKLINKFLESNNKLLTKYLLEIIHHLSEDDVGICRSLYEKNIMKVLTTYMRYSDNVSKIYAISLFVNIYSLLNLSFDTDSIFSWSISTLFGLLKEEKILKTKIRIMNIVTSIIKKSVNLQNTFFNLSCLDDVLKEFRSCFPEEKQKEMEEVVKNWKTKKEWKKFSEKESNSNSYILNSSLDDLNEYKKSIIDCLVVAASEKDELRKKIIDCKELFLVIYLLLSYEELSPKIVLTTCNLVFSLSRANIMYKKNIHDYEITEILFKISNHSHLDIQIAATSSLCNFLIDQKKEKDGILECITKLLKILNTTKHNKIRSNAVFAIKNIIYSANNQRDIKNSIMKKITYDLLAELCNDEDYTIQVQALYIFRILLVGSTATEIDEVLNNCKSTKLFKIIETKLELVNQDIICHSLFILCIISGGNDKQKSMIIENGFLKKIVEYTESQESKIKQVSLTIISNLLDQAEQTVVEKRIALLNDLDITTKLTKISNEEENKDITSIANRILVHMKNINKK